MHLNSPNLPPRGEVLMTPVGLESGLDADENSSSIKEKISISGDREVSPLDSFDNVMGESEHLSTMQRIKQRFPFYMTAIHIVVGAFFTAWWLSIVIQQKHRHQWLIPTILWGMIMVRLISMYCRVLPWIMRYVVFVWDFVVNIIYTRLLVERYQRLIAGGVLVVAVMLCGTFVTPESESSKRVDRMIAFLGCLVSVLALWLTSNNRSKIQWNTVISGYLMQFIIALFVLRTKCGYDVFNFISTLARELLNFAKDGVAFLTLTDIAQMPNFFFGVLPAVAFFVAFVHIWYYYGWVQWAIGKFAFFFFWTMRVSGAEAVTAAAAPFLGIGEAAILIKDLLPYLTKAELHQIMSSGFSTISGAVLVGYIGMGLNAQALVSSCVMSIPASLAVSKLRYPETDHPISCGTFNADELNKRDKNRPSNVLLAFSEGATLGVRIAGTMMGQIMCIIALVSLINGLLGWFGNYWNIDLLSLEKIFSYIFYPITFFLGAPRNETLHISRLIATKFVQNEYQGYRLLSTEEPYKSMSKRGKVIATYALCGFANFGSMGITLGVLNTLTNNSRSKDISATIWSALFTGFIATLTSAAVAGMVAHDLDQFIS